jgi:capsular exopolysaccharide synthesis family protein
MNKADSSNFAENTNMGSAQNKETMQRGLLEMSLRHRRLIFATIIFSLVVGFIYLLTAKPIYTGTARLYVEQTGPKLITDYATVMSDSKNYLYTQRELIKSTPIVASAANNPLIRSCKTFNNIDNIVAYMKGKLDVMVGKKDDIITISFDSPYAAEAAQIVNAVIDGYVEYHTIHKKGTVLEVLKILQKEKTKRDQELSDQMKEMLEFSQKNGLVAISDTSGGHIVLQRYAKLSDALTQAQLTTINAKTEYEAVLNMKDDPSRIRQLAQTLPVGAVNQTTMERESQLEAQLTQLEARLDELLRNCTENHPAVKAVKARIDKINKQLDEKTRELAEILHQRYLTAKETENQLLKSCEEQQQVAQDAGVKTTEFSILNSQIKRTERLCEILDERIKELNVTEDTGALNINILEAARTPETPSKPQKAKVMTFAMFLGLIVSFGLVFLREQFDNRLQSAEEASAVLGIPVLGIIPNISSEQRSAANIKDIWEKVRRRMTKMLSAIGTAQPAEGANRTTDKHEGRGIGRESKGPAGGFSRKLEELQTILKSDQKIKTTATIRKPVSRTAANLPAEADIKEGQSDEKSIYIARGQKVRLQPKSIAAEAYRTIRTSIFFGVPKGQAKTILITSPTVGDGKTTLVSNLGLTMAQAGQKTIIVDCDFRRPMQHNIFDVGRQTGLSNVITGNTPLSDAIQRGPIDNIDILACGADVPNPSELLNSELFLKILNELSSRYDRVLIDSPPVMPVADSQILGAICDITILVLRAEKSTKKISKLACDNLVGVGAHLLGAVINDVPQPKSRYGYYNYRRYGYYSYGYDYGYGYYDRKEKAKEAQEVNV